MKKEATQIADVRKPLTDKELDAIFNPARADQKESVEVGRSYGWADQTPEPTGN